MVVLTTRVPIDPGDFNSLGVLPSWLRAWSPLQGRRKEAEGEKAGNYEFFIQRGAHFHISPLLEVLEVPELECAQPGFEEN